MKKQLLTFAVGLAFTSIFAQNMKITFGEAGSTNPLSTVKVENITKGTSVTLSGSDTLLLTSASATDVANVAGDYTIQIVPNPMNSSGEIRFHAPIAGLATITITDAVGKIVASQQVNLQAGSYAYSIIGLPAGVYFATVTGAGYTYNTTIASIGTAIQAVALKQINAVAETPTPTGNKLKSLKADSTISMVYTTGDSLQFTETSGTLTSVIKGVPTASGQVTFVYYGTVKDQDNNSCKTIVIGTQTWFAENLKTTTYNDGTTIPNVTNPNIWDTLITGAVCTYNNTTYTDSINTFGRLYNWYAVNTGKLCPTSWHVPSDAEWTTLENYLIANGYNYDTGDSTHDYIAKSMASTTGWNSDQTAGDIGNNPSTNNKSGFTALPGGYRYYDGTFRNFGYYGDWWSSTEASNPSTINAYYWSLGFSSYLDYYGYPKVSGFSVRCLKD